MKKIILLYAFDPEELRKVSAALLPLKIPVRTVLPEEYTTPAGVLAGVLPKPADEPQAADRAPDRFVLMCGLSGPEVDRTLAALRKAGTGRDVLKAVLTPTNQDWSGLQLYEELKREHDYFHKGKPS